MKIKYFFGTILVSLPLLAYSTSPQEEFCSWRLATDSKYYDSLGENLAELQNVASKLQNLGAVDPQHPQLYADHVAEIAGEIQSTLASINLLQAQRYAQDTAKLQELFYPTPPAPANKSPQAAPSFWDKVKSLFISK